MRTSVICFATDLVDEGYETVLARLRDDAGADGITVACNYHHSRDVFPHNPRRRVRFFHGEVYFRPDRSRYRSTGLQPPLSPLVDDHDPLERLVDKAGRYGLPVRGWTNNTHNSRLGTAYPDATVRTCFGDPLVFALCPANPLVHDYLVALSGDLAERGLESLTCETLGYLPFDHGWHHERSYVPLSAAAKYVMGLCFCEHCQTAGRAGGVDVDALRAWCAEELDLVLQGRPRALGDQLPVQRDAIAALAGGELGGYLTAREATVTRLTTAVAEAAGGTPVTYMDVSGGLRGAGSGMTTEVTDDPATARSWQEGTDLAAIADACHGVQMLGYSREVDAVAADLEGYLRDVEPSRLSVALRPMAPDCDSADDLARKVALLRDAGIEWLDLYHYAFMPLDHLGWIGRAVRA